MHGLDPESEADDGAGCGREADVTEGENGGVVIGEGVQDVACHGQGDVFGSKKWAAALEAVDLPDDVLVAKDRVFVVGRVVIGGCGDGER